MDNENPKGVMVMLTGDLARRSLAAANSRGWSRSELVRRLLAEYLNGAPE
jgi:hypothetical protein